MSQPEVGKRKAHCIPKEPVSKSPLHSGRTGEGPPLRSFKFSRAEKKIHVYLGGEGVAKPRLKPLRKKPKARTPKPFWLDLEGCVISDGTQRVFFRGLRIGFCAVNFFVFFNKFSKISRISEILLN